MSYIICILFFFNDTATTEIYTLSLHDALPISKALLSSPKADVGSASRLRLFFRALAAPLQRWPSPQRMTSSVRSEEHTSELQSRLHLVCRLLLEKKKKTT